MQVKVVIMPNKTVSLTVEDGATAQTALEMYCAETGTAFTTGHTLNVNGKRAELDRELNENDLVICIQNKDHGSEDGIETEVEEPEFQKEGIISLNIAKNNAEAILKRLDPQLVLYAALLELPIYDVLRALQTEDLMQTLITNNSKDLILAVYNGRKKSQKIKDEIANTYVLESQAEKINDIYLQIPEDEKFIEPVKTEEEIKELKEKNKRKNLISTLRLISGTNNEAIKKALIRKFGNDKYTDELLGE